MKELSQEQIERQDFVDRSIYELIVLLNPSVKHIDWNIEMIADVRDRIGYWLTEKYRISDGGSFYPFVAQ